MTLDKRSTPSSNCNGRANRHAIRPFNVIGQLAGLTRIKRHGGNEVTEIERFVKLGRFIAAIRRVSAAGERIYRAVAILRGFALGAGISPEMQQKDGIRKSVEVIKRRHGFRRGV